ncbi:MAG: hypothetical protein AVDCRST_MAG13-3775, partial [uncultured Solirubrobacteraceae bacterium]
CCPRVPRGSSSPAWPCRSSRTPPPRAASCRSARSRRPRAPPRRCTATPSRTRSSWSTRASCGCGSTAPPCGRSGPGSPSCSRAASRTGSPPRRGPRRASWRCGRPGGSRAPWPRRAPRTRPGAPIPTTWRRTSRERACGSSRIPTGAARGDLPCRADMPPARILER